MSTPHIAAEKGEIAERILLPGDPLRAKFIAENFLDGAKEYTQLGKGSYTFRVRAHNLVTGEELSADERQTTFTNMMKIGLEAAVKMARQD